MRLVFCEFVSQLLQEMALLVVNKYLLVGLGQTKII